MRQAHFYQASEKMTIYDELQDVTREIMSEFKQGSCVYIRRTPGNGPVDNPGTSTIDRFELDAAARGVKYKYVASNLALASDLQVVASVKPEFTPDPTGMVEVDGLEYKIVQLLPIPAAGTPVAHTYIIRKP